MDRKKYVILGIVFLVLLLASILIVVISAVNNYNVWLNEYNAQMARFAYYKEDVKVLNQQIKIGWISAGFVVGSFGIAGFGLGLIWSIIEFVTY